MAKIESKHFTQLHLDEVKSDGWQQEPCSPISYGQTFSLVNLPLKPSRRRTTSVREAVAHELVFRCLEAKKLALADVLPVIQQLSGTGEWEPDIEHPAMPTLRNPNDEQTWDQFFTSLVVDEDVWGRFYIEKIRSAAGLVVAMKVLDVRGVREIGENGQVYAFDPYGYDWTIPYTKVLGYEVTEGGQAPRRIRKDDVIAVRAFDVRSPLAGLSAVFVALDAVGMAGSLRQYVDTYLRAGGPTGVISIKNKILSDEEAQDLSERFGRRYRLGSPELGNPAIFDDDGEYQQVGGHLNELDNSTLMEHEQAKICAALGVPGQVVGAFFAIRWGNQRAGQETAQAQFWENTLSPTLTRYRQIFDKWFLSDFEQRGVAGIKKRCFWDVSSVKALQEDVDKVSARARANYQAKIISLNEARTKQGFKPVAGGDQIQALVAEEAARVALEQQKVGNDPKNQNPRNSGAPNAKFPQKKTLELKRASSDLESEQVPDVSQAQDEAKSAITAILLALKAGLIKQALEKLDHLQAEYATLNLSLSFDQFQELRDAIEAAYRTGAATIAVGTIHAVESDTIEEITKGLVSMLLVGMASRLVGAYGVRKLRGMPVATILSEIAAETAKESTAFYEQLAAAAGYQAVADGRTNEAARRGYKRAYYSAILDKNVCENCHADDGKWSDNAEDLPPVPNPACLGTWRCRCVHVYVFDEA